MQSRATDWSVTFTLVPTIRMSSHRHCLATFGAVVLIGAGVVGCGGGDDEPPAPATATTGPTETVALTTEELIDEGDAICAEVNAAIGTIDASTADETSKAEQRADLYDGVAERLGELGTPSDGEAPEDVIAAAEDLADGGTDVRAFQTAAEEYGFTDCAEAPEMPEVSTGAGGDPGTATDPGAATAPEEPYVPPATETPAEPTPSAPAAPSGGGVAPAPTPAPTPAPSPSTGGSSSGGIGPG